MQPKMWDKVKETILYVRSKGHRVDAIGWQGHIKLSDTTKGFVEDTDNTIKQLSELVDWAHANNLEFHITELDYKIKDKSNIQEEHLIQAELYSKLVSLLESKIATGVVALNLWDMGERFKKNTGYFQSIYDADLNPTPAYQIIKNALKK
jgi:GH35 family endo-1,4-beta-xylanase